MADLNANINVGIETTQALNQLKALQKQISQFHQSVAKSSNQAALAQRDLQRNFLNGVNAIQGFSAELKTVRTTAETFTNSLEKNKFSMREYFRYSAGATKTFGKNFAAEMSTIEKTAIERVKTLQTQYIKMGRDATGAMQAIAIRPTVLNMKDLGTQTAIAAQKQVLFNQLLKQGSTNLLNFGKNTQWAGRQLMVGFTLPLATLGMTAGRVFFDMEKAAIKFKKVYGDLFTAPAETQKAMDSIVELGEAYSAYGIAVSDALNMASDAAAAGFAGVDLQNQTAAALKLSVLGQLELQKALETTISLQNAFQLSSTDLAGEIDFLNAVENQTVVALDDMTEAIPRVAPVIKQLGGDVRDLAFFLAAMKEGGINAAQGANALKSGLASLINPTERAAQMLAGFGVNIRSIVSSNQGDIAGTVYDFAKALDDLDPLKRAQAIEQLFGKFQFARISALFDNITRDGTQAQRVLELAGSSAEELAALSESELGVSAASSMNKFRSAVEKLKVALVPIGELFVQIATPFVEFGTRMLDAFNSLPGGIKTAVGTVITILGGIGPVALMTFGLINNGIANMIKFFATVRLGYLKITGQAKGVGDETQYMTQEQLEAAAAAASLDQAHAGLTQRFTAEKSAVDALRVAYQQAADAGARFALLNPGMMKPGTQAKGFAKGGVVSGPGTGTSDSIPALLSNGEAVIPAKQAKEYAPIIQGMIAGNLPGFAKGVMLGMPRSAKNVSKSREAGDAIYEEFLKSSYANTPPTEYGHQISPTSGHSFPIFNLGGVYQKGNKRVFVKPVMDETAALAEIRSTQITRQAHGLEAPEQRIVVIRDPLDPTRQRRFLALESDLDAKFIQNEPKALFNEEQYFRQLVASLLRVDKDLAPGNVFGNVVADVGPAGVFDRASGKRALKTDLPSMEEQAMINLLGIKGGAKRAFAESTLALMAGLTPEQYHQRMIAEIQKVLPALKKTVAEFGLSNPTEAKAYDAMIKRLEAGLGVDWSKFHAIHSNVKIATPKKPKAVAGYAKGVVSVPGPKGKGDTVPAMLSPGEAIIPAAMAKKYAPLIQGIIAGNIPGYQFGTASVGGRGSVTVNGKSYETRGGSEEGIARIVNDLISFKNNVEDVTEMLDRLEKSGKLTITSLEEAAKANDKIISENPNKSESIVSGHLQGTSKILPSGERETGSFVRRMTQSQNTLLDKGGQYAEDFIRDWNKVSDPLIATVKLGGQEITDGIRQATDQIDDDIRDIAVAMANGQKITDEILEKAANEALARAKARGGDSELAANALERTKGMKVIKPATIGSLLDSEALKSLKEAGVIVGKVSADELARKLKEIGWLTEGTGNARGDLLATEEGAALSSKGAGGRVFRTNSDGKYVAPERYVAEGMDKTYFNLDTSMAKLVDNIKDEVGTGIDKASAAASPSVKISNATNNLVDGVEETIVNSKDDVARATEEMLSPVTQKPTGPRRAIAPQGPSSDPVPPAVATALAGNQAALQASRGYRSASRPGDMETRLAAQAAATLASTTQDVDKNAKTLGDKFSSLTIGISAVSGILSMFGGEMAGVAAGISMVTGGLYTLSMISQALAGTKIAEMIATKAATVAKGMGGAADIAGTVANREVMKSIASTLGTGGIFSKVANGLKFLGRFLGVAGIAISALAIAIPFIVNLYQQQKAKMEAFGNIIDVTADQIKFLGQQAGVSVTTASGFTRATLGQAETATDAANEKAADEQFLEQFKTQIAATKAGALDSVNQALEVLAFKLSSSGLPDEFVNSTIAGIIQASGRTDLEFDFNKVGISPANTAGLLTDLKSRISTATEMQQTEGYQAAFNRGPNPASTQELKDVGANVAALMEGLSIQLEAGTITIEEYSRQFDNLRLSLVGLEGTAKETAIGEAIDKIFPDDKEMSNAIKGVEDLDKQMLLLELAGVGGSEAMQKFVDMTKDGKVSKAQYVTEIKKEIAAQKKLNDVKALETFVSEQTAEADALRDKIAVYDELVAAGLNAAEAYRIAGDAALTEGYRTALAAGDLQKWIDGVNEIAALTAEFENRNPSRGGGGSDPIQDAIKGLKEQRQEILNTSAAYSQLRNSGMSAANAFKFAQNPELLSAMNAGLKVGSARWNEIIGLIKEAEAATKAWQNSTVQGKTEQFEDIYNRVMTLFDAEEAVLEAAFESATASDNKLIKSLEEQIDVLNRRVEDYSRDLDGIAEQEEAINKAYDEKVKALEETKRINEDILRQQKSQLSLADALSQGDIGAAASALQESRSANAAAALGAQGNMLQLSREAELANVKSPGGLTRVQIEEKVKQLKKDIAAIEFGALRDAQDRVTAAEKELQAKKEALTVAGTTRTQLEAQKVAIDQAKARAEVYDSELQSALANVEGIVSGWKSLDTTIRTNHVVNTTYTGSPPAAPAAPVVPVLDSETARQRAAANRARAQYTSANGGYISGPGTGTSDSIPAMLSDGEYVIKAASVNKFGKGFLDAINAGRLPGFKLGGMLRDGGGSSKSFAPIKAGIPRKTAAASATAPRQSALEKALPIILPYAQQMMDITGSITAGKEMGQALVSLVGGKAASGDFATLGLGALGFVPGGGAVSKVARFAKRIRGLRPDVPKVEPKLPDLSKIGDKLPAGMRALIDDMTMIHRSENPTLVTKHPSNVAVYQGNTQGPGTYFYRNRKESLDKGWQYGGYTYQQKHTPLSALKTASSKGYLDFQKATFDMQAFVSGKRYDSEVVQDLMKQGYIGMRDPNTGIMTNWLTGTKGGPTLKKVGQQSGVLERLASMFNTRAKFAKGGMVKPSYYAGGGMVKPSYYSNGGFAKGTDTVPAMLTPGEFVMNRNASKNYGPLLSAINDGGRSFTTPVYPEISRAYPSANIGGGLYTNNSVAEIGAPVDNSVYNYSLSVNVAGTNATPDQIANVVMRKLQGVESQRVRGQVVR
jgi:TP901 family phage tail tape measure protein